MKVVTRRLSCGGVLLCVAVLANCASAPQASRRERGAVIAAAAEHVATTYINEDVGRAIADSLTLAQRLGRFDGLDDEAFMRAVRGVLLRLSSDPHMGMERALTPEPAPGRTESELAPPAATGLEAYSVGRAEFIEPGVAYLELLGFNDDEAALAVVDSIMAGFADAHALIIDLRHNTGGGPQMVRLVSTYLFDEPTHLVSSFMRGMERPMERWTLDATRGRRMPRTPVYVLTSRRTFSAAESFVFGLKTNDRITIVGEPTGGGGHFGQFVDLPDGFIMFIPYGRTFDPRTNRGWQSDGIQPDVAVPAETALEEALKRLRR